MIPRLFLKTWNDGIALNYDVCTLQQSLNVLCLIFCECCELRYRLSKSQKANDSKG